jgi:glycosyltransferase involved in cell wall biosynthesis
MEQYQAVAMALVDHVILPSQYARRLFPKRYRQYAGQLHTAPLLIKDRISHAGSDNQRSTFSYVGRIHAGTGFSDFINLINYTASVNSDKTFIIVTSSSTKSYLKRLNPKAFNHLTIVNAPIILDSHIDLALSKSIATFRLDRDITQSGVVPVSYMHGTPVIARDLPGFAQHVDHGRNGYLVKRDFLEQDLLTAMRYVEEHRESLVWSARSSYEAMWSPTHWLEHYKWLLDAVN